MTARNPAAAGALARGDLENFLVASTPGGIEASEKRGQLEVAANFNRLPIDDGYRKEGRPVAEKLGFVFGEAYDDVFINVTAPAGWSLRPTDHSMHSDILDAKGRVRGSMFYKAAFYDRRAHYRWSTRYQVGREYPIQGDYDVHTVDARDTASGEKLWASPRLSGYEEAQAAQKEAAAFLDQQYPDWHDPVAYWDAG